MGELVEAAKALSAPATKLIEVVSRGIGRAYDPRYKKKMADASVYELDVLADAVRRNSDLPILIDRDGVQLDSRSIQELAERTKARLFSQEMRKQQNIEAIVDNAYEELQKETEVTSDPVDDDWIIRFFNSVEDVSSEKLRKIWARLLTGEIKAPHTYSMRTLDILRSISSIEATLVEQLASCTFRQGKRSFIPNLPELWKTCGVNYEDLFSLSCAGVMSNTPLDLKLLMKNAPRIINNDFIIGVFDSIADKPDAIISVPIYSYTASGHEILSVVAANREKSIDSAIKYFTILKEHHRDCDISAFRILGFKGDLILHDDNSLI
jgi:hypothetical protein